jgi:hypothetical protein
MNKRFEVLIEPNKDVILGTKVLDLTSHDGRWCYAFAGAGAASVVGIEGRQEMVDKFPDYPDAARRDKVELRVGDLYDGMEAAIGKVETYDVIGVFGILYHLMDHFRLFQLVRRLKPKLVIVDSEFMLRPASIMMLVSEKTSNVLNAIPQYDGQDAPSKRCPASAPWIAWPKRSILMWIGWIGMPAPRMIGARYLIITVKKKCSAARACCGPIHPCRFSSSQCSNQWIL